MTRRSFLLGFLGLSLFIAVFLRLGIYFSLDWTTEWFDIVLHFAGGVWVAAITFIFFSFQNYSWSAISGALLPSILAVIFLVGFSWEWFELSRGYVLATAKGYYLDTLLDIIFDTVGAVVAYLLFTRFIK